jgi:hypothetical protein
VGKLPEKQDRKKHPGFQAYVSAGGGPVSTRVTRGDRTVLDDRPPTVRARKILNGTHYSLVTLRNDVFARAATGRYRVVGDSYSETVDLASGSFTPGRTYTFRIRVDGDTWTTDGDTGADQLHEVWRRVP